LRYDRGQWWVKRRVLGGIASFYSSRATVTQCGVRYIDVWPVLSRGEGLGDPYRTPCRRCSFPCVFDRHALQALVVDELRCRKGRCEGDEASRSEEAKTARHDKREYDRWYRDRRGEAISIAHLYMHFTSRIAQAVSALVSAIRGPAYLQSAAAEVCTYHQSPVGHGVSTMREQIPS
jgi:hypothetical protein